MAAVLIQTVAESRAGTFLEILKNPTFSVFLADNSSLPKGTESETLLK